MPFPLQTCPYCGNDNCSAEWCDVGVGHVQMGPYHCEACTATEMGPYDKQEATATEKEVGWYAPGKLPETVSSVNGFLLPTHVALRLYENGAVPSLPCRLEVSDARFVEMLGFRLSTNAPAAAITT